MAKKNKLSKTAAQSVSAGAQIRRGPEQVTWPEGKEVRSMDREKLTPAEAIRIIRGLRQAKLAVLNMEFVDLLLAEYDRLQVYADSLTRGFSDHEARAIAYEETPGPTDQTVPSQEEL